MVSLRQLHISRGANKFGVVPRPNRTIATSHFLVGHPVGWGGGGGTDKAPPEEAGEGLKTPRMFCSALLREALYGRFCFGDVGARW